jgi:hypothetical protein
MSGTFPIIRMTFEIIEPYWPDIYLKFEKYSEETKTPRQNTKYFVIFM